MDHRIFAGLPEVVQQHIISPALRNNLYDEFDSVGGYRNWRDLCIMENTKQANDVYIKHKNSFEARVNFRKQHDISARDIIFILNNSFEKNLVLANKIDRSEWVVSKIRCKLRGSLYFLKYPAQSARFNK